MSKRAQATVFIIIGIVILAGVALYFILRETVGSENIPEEISPVYDYYQGCIEQELRLGVQLIGMGGGRIGIDNYVPGSEYAPFSSHLNFLGSPVKYWYYVSGSGLIKEQVPTKEEMETEISEFVKEGLRNCNFEVFYRQGFAIDVGEPDVETAISENKVDVKVSADMVVSRESETARKTEHNAEIRSKLGKFYNLAKEIYAEEKKESFLEQYSVDVLYNYAPVDGVEVQCKPEIWLTSKIIGSLQEGLQENIATIKLDGSYYELGQGRDYFVWNKRVDEAVNFMYSGDWPTKVEIYGDGVDDEIMVSEPVGTQAGLGILGFCYVPYHFVYDVSFPVLIQLYDTEELFQFPVVVVIDKNVPRNALISQMPVSDTTTTDLCAYKNKEIVVDIYDMNLNPVDANISYECFNQKCSLGESKEGKLVSIAPACVNGYLNIRADGFAEKKQLFSTNENKFVDVVLEKEYEVEIELKIGGKDLEGTAIVSFTRDDGESDTIALPEINKVKLSEGNYEVRVYVYGNSSIRIPESTKTECTEVPKAGLLGVFGGTKEECFDITVPETNIDYALVGGGVLNTYLLDSELKKGHVTIGADKLPVPNSIDDLAQNFDIFENKKIWMEFNDRQ